MKKSRTKRRRSRKQPPGNVDSTPSIIALKKAMVHSGWRPLIDLRLREFKSTGRGVYSTQIIHENSTLIEIPFHLMISIVTVMQSEIPDIINSPDNTNASHGAALKAQDYLSLFLMLEKHKPSSSWSWYLDTLPEEPAMPWFDFLDKSTLTPLLGDSESLDSASLKEDSESLRVGSALRTLLETKRTLFNESWSRLKKSIRPDWTCPCCKKSPDRVFTLNTFRWAYVMVNTRAVYVDPKIIRELLHPRAPEVADEPSLALCPFLDMFNHSDRANTSVELTPKESKKPNRKGLTQNVGTQKEQHTRLQSADFVYKLKTHIKFSKYEQIFILYGQHPNEKLFTEYGFTIPDNSWDSVKFTLKEVLLGLEASSQQYKLMKTFQNDLYVSKFGLSFNLKAVLYVLLARGDPRCKDTIYTDNYKDEDLIRMHSLVEKCLASKMQIFLGDLHSFKCRSAYSAGISTYLEDRVTLAVKLREMLNSSLR